MEIPLRYQYLRTLFFILLYKTILFLTFDKEGLVLILKNKKTNIHKKTIL